MEKILIIDDNTLFRRMLKESLHSRFPSLTISEAKDGGEALETIPTLLPDLIFMDIRLPNGNGLELTRVIKGLYPDIKIVVLTSYDLPEYRDAAFLHKADYYVPKDSFMTLMDVIVREGPLD